MTRPADLYVEGRIHTIMLKRLRENGFSDERIPRDMPILGKGLGLDSIEAVALALDIEAEFGILIDDDDLTADLFEDLGTLADHVQYMLSKTTTEGLRHDNAT